jgi:hypothetical protein
MLVRLFFSALFFFGAQIPLFFFDMHAFQARNGSPLVVGIGKDAMFIASEFTAFCRHTNEYISLHDGEVCSVFLASQVIETHACSAGCCPDDCFACS